MITFSTSGKEGKNGWGLSLGTGTSKLTIGGRIQGLADTNLKTGTQDLYLRRARVNLQYETKNHHLIYLDLRNDNSNKRDNGEGSLQIGDAFYEVPFEDLGIIKNITLFRSKVDVSYSQTASSKNLINPNRESSSDYASNFIVHNRRATNIQLHGENEWMTFQVVVSDGVQSDSLNSTFGSTTLSSINKQSFTYGGKARFFIWNPSKEKAPVQETFYKPMNTLSLGIGYFLNPNVNYTLSDGRSLSESRELLNIEVSFAWNNFRLIGEGFLFKGDLINLSQSKIGDSQGGYLRGELLIGKLAPYFGFNVFKRDKDNDNSYEKSQMLGLNYYDDGVSRRYGISYKISDYSDTLTQRDQKQLMTYLMLDY